MSYILDALKKSEAERSNRDHPEFGHRVPFESAPRKQRELWPYLLVLALLANALVVVYVMWPESRSGEAAVAKEPAPVQDQQLVEPESVNTAPEQPKPKETEAPEPTGVSSPAPDSEPSVASEPSEPAVASPPEVPEERPSETSDRAPSTDSRDFPMKKEEQVASAEPPAEASEEVPDINAMPRSVQRRVPDMTFNAHLHSSNPSSRRVMINNRMLREGDRVGDLVVREITPAGVVFKLDQHVFQIDVVRDWQGGF